MLTGDRFIVAMKIKESFLLPPAYAWPRAGESLAWSSPASSYRQTDRQTHTHTHTHSFPYSEQPLLTLGFCWSISLLSGSLDVTSPHLLFLYFWFSFPFTPLCLFLPLCVSVLHFSSLCSASLSSIFPFHLSPRFLLLARSCPPWSPGLKGGRLGRWGPGCVCRGVHSHLTHPSQNSEGWFSPLWLAWVPVISSAFRYEAQIAHQKG